MKLKYYLRGLGIGIIVTTIILMICFSRQKSSVSDEEIMKRAAELGMIMPEEDGAAPEDSEMESTELETGLLDQNENTDASNKEEENQTGEPAQDVMAHSEPAQQDAAEPSGASEPVSTEPSGETTQDNAAPSGEPPQDSQQGTAEVYCLKIQHGDVCRTVCDTLAANGVIADSESFRKYLMELGYASFLSVGEYDIPYGLSMEEVAEILKAGPARKTE